MAEKIYLTQKIKEILTGMAFGPKEKIALYLGDKVSPNEIYVTNTTGAFEGEVNSVSFRNLFKTNDVIATILYANRILRENYGRDRYVLIASHSHPRQKSEIVQIGDTAWSVDDVPLEYEESRGRVISVNDKDGNLIQVALKVKSDGKGGDDIHLKQIADEWRQIEYAFFIRPPLHLTGKPFNGEVAIDCYKYDPEMKLGKIRKIELSDYILTPKDLIRTALDPNKLKIVETEEGTGNFVLPYRRR